ncbi:hypothetical protein V8E52_008824 [Russula decolorans]
MRWPGLRLIPLFGSLLVTYKRVRVEALDFCASHSSSCTTCGVPLPISGLVELVRSRTLDLGGPPCPCFSPHSVRCKRGAPSRLSLVSIVISDTF